MRVQYLSNLPIWVSSNVRITDFRVVLAPFWNFNVNLNHAIYEKISPLRTCILCVCSKSWIGPSTYNALASV